MRSGGERAQDRRSARDPADHKTKIVATIGPASESPEMLERLIRAGLNVARLNFSHGDFAGHAERIARIRAAAQRHRPARRHHGRPARPEDARRQDRAGADPAAPRRSLHADQRGHRRQRAAGLDELRAPAPGREAGRPALPQRRPGATAWSSAWRATTSTARSRSAASCAPGRASTCRASISASARSPTTTAPAWNSRSSTAWTR